MFSVGDGENICSNSPPLYCSKPLSKVYPNVFTKDPGRAWGLRDMFIRCVWVTLFLIGGLLLSTVSISVKSKTLEGFTVHFMGLGRSSHCVEKFSRHRLFLERTLQR